MYKSRSEVGALKTVYVIHIYKWMVSLLGFFWPQIYVMTISNVAMEESW